MMKSNSWDYFKENFKKGFNLKVCLFPQNIHVFFLQISR